MFFYVSFFSMIVLTLILLSLSLALGYRSTMDREKLSPFECGFTPKFSARMPFSIRFFLVSIIFLIFDVELILIFPLIPALSHSSIYLMYFTILAVVLILMGGLLHEIFHGSLSWSN